MVVGRIKGREHLPACRFPRLEGNARRKNLTRGWSVQRLSHLEPTSGKAQLRLLGPRWGAVLAEKAGRQGAPKRGQTGCIAELRSRGRCAGRRGQEGWGGDQRAVAREEPSGRASAHRRPRSWTHQRPGPISKDGRGRAPRAVAPGEDCACLFLLVSRKDGLQVAPQDRAARPAQR